MLGWHSCSRILPGFFLFVGIELCSPAVLASGGLPRLAGPIRTTHGGSQCPSHGQRKLAKKPARTAPPQAVAAATKPAAPAESKEPAPSAPAVSPESRPQSEKPAKPEKLDKTEQVQKEAKTEPAPTFEPEPTTTVLAPALAAEMPIAHAEDPGAGVPLEIGLPGWMKGPPAAALPFDWHGNLELDMGNVVYGWGSGSGLQPESVFDSRGRSVFGPTINRDLGDGYHLRVTGQVVAWVRESYNTYQVNAEDVYVQVGKTGSWDLRVGRFLTWRVFRKGMGFDLYTLEESGARLRENFTDPSGFFPHTYEVNTIFMRDSFGKPSVPSGRAALHFYPNPWSGIEAVMDYGRLDAAGNAPTADAKTETGGNALGFRIAAGIKAMRYFNLLGAGEWMRWRPGQVVGISEANSFRACDSCANWFKWGFGGSASITPTRWLELTGDYGYLRTTRYKQTPVDSDRQITTLSWGGYAQIDFLYLLMRRSLFLGSGFFRTEVKDDDRSPLFQTHDQLAVYAVYPLGFNNAVIKLVYSRAIGRHEQGQTPPMDAVMNAVRIRFAYYY